MAQVILEQEERLEETLIKSLSVICPGTNHTLIFLLSDFGSETGESSRRELSAADTKL